MKKRWLSLLLALCMALTLLPFGALAEDAVPSGKCGEHVFWEFKDGVLTITGNGEMSSWFGSDPPWAQYRSAMKSVVIEQNVTNVGSCAFQSSDYSNDPLVSVTLPSTIKTIGKEAFSNCWNLKTINLPEGLETIERQAFWICKNLNPTIPDSVTTIGERAFASTGTTSVKGKNLQVIGFHAFSECKLLKEVTLPKTLTAFGLGAFAKCFALSGIEIDPDNPNFCSVDGVVFTKDKRELVEISSGRTGDYAIPGSVNVIRSLAFYSSKLSNIFVPDSVEKLCSGAFYDCDNLKELSFTDGIQEIEGSAVKNCSNLKRIYIPAVFLPGKKVDWRSLTDGNTALEEIYVSPDHPLYCTVDGAVFSKDKTALCCVMPVRADFTIPEGTKTIDFDAFYACKALQTIDIPSSVTKIQTGAFLNCTDLTDVYFGGTAEEWNGVTIQGANEPLKNATMHFLSDTPTVSPAPSTKPTASPAPSAKPTASPAPSAKPTASPAPSAKPTASPAPTAKPTASPAPTAKPTASPAPTAKPTASPAPTAKPTASPAPTAKPTATPAPASNPFKDVSKDQYYYEPVLWAVNHDPQITAGTAADAFSPNNPCTRGQIVTFLWRAKGCPEPTITKNPFTDVKSSDYFYKAVLWAVEKEITAGTSKTTFSPAATVTRAQTVTFLWRAEGKPAVQTKNPFTDVPAGQYYTDAVLWAVKNEITAGTSATTFSPANPCTRAQIVTFLYRDLAK